MALFSVAETVFTSSTPSIPYKTVFTLVSQPPQCIPTTFKSTVDIPPLVVVVDCDSEVVLDLQQAFFSVLEHCAFTPRLINNAIVNNRILFFICNLFVKQK